MGMRLSAEVSGATLRLLEKQFAPPSALVNSPFHFNGAVMEEGITCGEASQANRKDLHPGEETNAGNTSPLFLLEHRDASAFNRSAVSDAGAVLIVELRLGWMCGVQGFFVSCLAEAYRPSCPPRVLAVVRGPAKTRQRL
ncbi:hypothetical protein AOLI_G00330480 [Acnodon oligacanthus]